MKFSTEDDPQTLELRKRLDLFYATAKGYASFESSEGQPMFWGPVKNEIQSCVAIKGLCRVLEFGAGCTHFRTFIGEDLAKKITFHVQDVTDRNWEHLDTQADHIHVGDVREIGDEYDIIFSTFIWEHISIPRAVLDHLMNILTPGGSLILAAPRYDFPFYLSPSARHYSKLRQVGISAWLLLKRASTALGGRPSFLIHLDPALFHRPWFRDSDAVHLASWYDLKRYVPRGWKVRRLRISVTGWKRRLWEKYMLMFVHLRKPLRESSGE